MKVTRKMITGIVVSHNMKKTIVVAVSRTFRHPRYKKYLHGVKTYKVHDERDTCAVNDIVEIIETRPLSKEKRWRVIRVVEHAKGNIRKVHHEEEYEKKALHSSDQRKDTPPTVSAAKAASGEEGK